MIRILLLVALTLFTSQPAAGQQDRFDAATRLLEEQRVTEAMAAYREIEQQGYHSGMLFFNMGVAALYQDSLGLAKSYFMRAERHEDVREEADRALRHVNTRFDRRSAVLPPPPWEQLFDRLDESFGKSMLMALAILFLHLAAGSLLLSWRRPRFKRFYRWSAMILFSVALFGAFSAFHLDRIDNRYATGVMIQATTTLYEQPDRQSSGITTVHEGFTMRVDLLSGESGWYRVRLQNGMTGWIEKPSIQAF